MPAIRIYESALCCDTGVCGPDVDQSLVEVTADVRHLQGLGADIARHNLASEPTAFAEDETVRGFMHLVGFKGSSAHHRRRRDGRHRNLSQQGAVAGIRRTRRGQR